jgi:tetratricopeptide (TPR) repeat protein
MVRRFVSLSLALSLTTTVLLTSHSDSASASAGVEPVAEIQAILVGDVPANDFVQQVQIKRASGSSEAAKVGVQLFVDDEITTGANVSASLVFTKPNSEERIDVQIQANSSAKIGSFFYFVGRFFVSGWGAFDTQTRHVRLGKRGTEYHVEVAEDGSADIKVLRGEVEVETLVGHHSIGSRTPPRSSATPKEIGETVEKRSVGPLSRLVASKGQPLPDPTPLPTPEVEKILTETDNLMLATVATTPGNIVVTSYQVRPDLMGDPIQTRIAATIAFKETRRAAVLQPSAENIAKLGDAYKDLGAGKRALAEYDEALIKKPALRNSAAFLANQSESYRLAGNLVKAQEKGNLAVQKSLGSNNPKLQLIAYNAQGNASFDRAVMAVAENKWEEAGAYFKRSEKSFELANLSARDDYSKFVSSRNLLNVKYAMGVTDIELSTPNLTAYQGTYRGTVSFPGAGIFGNAVLVITGNRFSLVHCGESLTGTIIASRRETNTFEFVFDTSLPIKRLALNVALQEKQLTLSNSTSESSRFVFTTNSNQTGLRCVRATGYR